MITATELQKLQGGKQFTITLVRDDQPIKEGTPYSKAAVLPDEIAALICPDVDDPTPADAFKALANGKAGSKHTHDASDVGSGTFQTARLPVVPVTKGGTGRDFSNAPANAIVRKISDGSTLTHTATANGAMYATEANGLPKFGTLPIAQGGTGSASASGARANLGLNIPTYTSFEQLGLTASCTTAEVFAAMPNPSIFVFQQLPSNTLKITDSPNQYALIEIYRANTYGVARSCKISSKVNDPLTTFEASLYLDGSTQTVNMLGWKQGNVTYSLTKDGSTITLTGSDGSSSSVTDTYGSGTSTSSGMVREFNSGALDEQTTFSYSGIKSKIYVVEIIEDGTGDATTMTFDYQMIKDHNNTRSLYTNLNGENVKVTATLTSSKITFTVNTSGYFIHHVCGYY